MTFDPRKTQVLADFATVLRGADALRDPRSDAADEAPAVVVGRTVIASGEPRSLALAKTQVWRGELTLHAKTELSEETRERAQVHVDESVMQHLSAEVWAGQLTQTSRMMVTEVRRSVVDVQASFMETQRSTRPTPLTTEVFEPVRIPRRLQMPDTKTLRIAGAVMCIVSATIVVASAMSGRRGPAAAPSNALLKPAAVSGEQSQPVDVKSTWRAEQPKPAARNSAEPGPMIASATQAPTTEVASYESKQPATAAAKPAIEATKPTITTTAQASPRTAVDALIAGKRELAVARYRALAKSHPNDPVYEEAARILEEAQQRTAE
jgi:hypothetical protein